jgi:putative DNA primase/helicase
MTFFDVDQVRRWLGILHGDAAGLVHICSTGNWTGAAFSVDQLDAAAAYVSVLNATNPEGIYVRVTTLKAALAPGTRGGASDTSTLTALWADIDIAGPGHKSEQKLPPDEAAARAIIDASGLPEATLWVHSGGGLYPFWLLTTPHLVGDELVDVGDLAANWQRAIGHGATVLGWHYGTGVGDLARVLRIPGTVNRKAGLERPCKVVSVGGKRYSFEELNEYVAEALSQIPEVEPPAPRLSAVRLDDGSVSPGDSFAAQTEWADILVPAGWRYAHERGDTTYWRRPGKDTAGISATTNALGTDRLRIFTTSTDFEVTSYSKLGAYAVLEHGGDMKAAAKALQSQGFGKGPTLSPAITQSKAIAELVPDSIPPGIPVLSVVDGTAVRVIAEPKIGPEKYGPTEDGMALALVVRHGHELRYCPQRGNWLSWNGHVWAWDDGETHREMIRSLARELPEEKPWHMFKRRAMSASGVAGIARLAQSDARVVTSFASLDAKPYEMNTPAGIIDLRTGLTRAADPAGLHTRTTACAPDASLDASMWLMFLSQTFGNNAELVSYLQRLVGYSAIGQVRSHVLPFAYGFGGNGKGVFLEAASGVLGDYATTAPVGFLMKQTHTGHETEIARLAGARMVLCSEVNEGDRFDEAKVKQLTGGDTLTARFMRADHFSFRPTHQLWLMGNHKPEVRSGGRAFWRRLRLIPFLHEVPEERVVEDLQGVLVRDHGPALLAWIVAGAADFVAGGLREPTSVRAATDEYAREQDTVARFVEECCRVGGGEAVKTRMSDIWETYERWCATGGEATVTRTAFGLALKSRFGVGETRARTARFYVGISLWGAEDSSPDQQPVTSGRGGRDS